MVTRDTGSAKEAIEDLFDKKSDRWDLLDNERKDAWWLRTLGKLQEDPEAYAAIQADDPITSQMITNRSPSIPATRANAEAATIETQRLAARARGYRALLQRLDFTKRPAVAAKIVKEIAPQQNGAALFRMVTEAMSVDTPEKQAEVQRQYDRFAIRELTTPEALADQFALLGSRCSCRSQATTLAGMQKPTL